MALLKNLSNVWRTLEMPLINRAISLQLIWSINCFLVADTAANQGPIFKIIDTKLYVPVVTLSTQDNVKLLKQFESGFEKQLIGININLKDKSSIKHIFRFFD